jgi:osmotically-inducible protein OsmY
MGRRGSRPPRARREGSGQRLDVTVSKGWVTLKGDVEWQYQRQDAERVVRRFAGVKGVTNLIIVRPRVTPTDLK